MEDLAAIRPPVLNTRRFDDKLAQIGKKDQQASLHSAHRVRSRSSDKQHLRCAGPSQSISAFMAKSQSSRSLIASPQNEFSMPHSSPGILQRREDRLYSGKLRKCLSELPPTSAGRTLAASCRKEPSPEGAGFEAGFPYHELRLGQSVALERRGESSCRRRRPTVNLSEADEQMTSVDDGVVIPGVDNVAGRDMEMTSVDNIAGRSTERGRRNEQMTSAHDDVVIPRVDSAAGRNMECGRKSIQQLQNGQKIYDKYYWEEVLQETGSGGKVVVCQPKSASPKRKSFDFVMKIQSKETLRNRHVHDHFKKLHLRMLSLPKHANILPMHEVLEDEHFYYIVSEKANCGSLLQSLVKDFKDGCMPASAVKQVMQQILQGVGHLHKHGILHRDIKPDNIVVHTAGNRKDVMLIDFDHADPNWSPTAMDRRSGLFGTLRFNAPETFVGRFSPQSDLYSVGTILYLLMTGNFPFSEEVYIEAMEMRSSELQAAAWREAMYKRMEQAKIDFACDPWPQQHACKELCQRLLAFEPEARPSSAEDVLAHSWLLECDAETLCSEALPEALSNS